MCTDVAGECRYLRGPVLLFCSFNLALQNGIAFPTKFLRTWHCMYIYIYIIIIYIYILVLCQAHYFDCAGINGHYTAKRPKLNWVIVKSSHRYPHPPLAELLAALLGNQDRLLVPKIPSWDAARC